MDYRAVIKRSHDKWVDDVRSQMQMKKITYDELAEVLGITRQSVWLKLIKKKTPILAVEKEIINYYLKGE